MKKVCFKVEGEWLTNFFRTRFWDDKCGYETAIKIIQDSLGDISEDLCIDILEGRKKLVGINELDLVEDNENIRPLSKYIKQQEEENRKKSIMLDIENYPYKYIDYYACCVSHVITDIFEKDNLSAKEIQEELAKRTEYTDILLNGCDFIIYTKRTADIIMRLTNKNSCDKNEFQDIIFKFYEELIDSLREKKISYSELDEYYQAIIWRNGKYAQHKKISWDYLGEKTFNRKFSDFNKTQQSENIKEEFLKEHEEYSLPMINFLDKNGVKVSDISDLLNTNNNDDFDTSPTEPKGGWDGYIDREGYFYPTKPIGIRWYKGTANCHYEWAVQYLKENNIEYSIDAKDYMIDVLGWCDISHLTLVSSTVYVNIPRNKGFSDRQAETLKKIFELNKEDMSKYEGLIERSNIKKEINN